MDMDSAYMGLSGVLKHIIKPELRKNLYNNYADWFPRMVCDVHSKEFISVMRGCGDWDMAECCKAFNNKFDQQTLGLFKD